VCSIETLPLQRFLIVVDSTLQELGKSGDATKQALYRACREEGAGSQPLKITLPSIATPSLLDRVQERLDVEGALRQLRKQRLKERGNAVYIPPQAKASLQAPDESQFPLMEAVKKCLSIKSEVFLVLGDSGSGKSTFNRELECQLWQSYKKGGRIPLHISLPAIDKPEHDMIAKQLRKVEFTEPQIRELKQYRKFVLICDGYDESQQTHNLYTSNRLNEQSEWQAKMVISCRSEYVGIGYRDRFQPGDRNSRTDASLFQEAVITPFSLDQVQDYITQYVSVHRPLWEAKEYKEALERIPSLKELVKNPFLMSLTLEVLPRMVDPTQNLSSAHITRVALYDQFVEHWLERGKRRLGEKNLSPQARAAFESLSDEGFTQNGIDFLKRLSVAIYKEQGGQPVVRYSRYKDGGSWKANFFNREDERQLLREACPLIRSGNQHRFIHRSLLEYGLALSVFDPADLKERRPPESSLARRGSLSSDMSFVISDNVEEDLVTTELKPDLESPLAWRSYVNEPSVLQFLEERVEQESLFKNLLLKYIELSKEDKMWRTAAANAVTILVRAGVQFNGTDLQGVQIPGADLSYGVFESAQLQKADLRHVSLRGAWLPRANLSKAQVKGIQFGELPFLKHKGAVVLGRYSPDGETFAVGLQNGQIVVYSASSWEELWTASEQGYILSLAYSPKGDQIVTSSNDHSVRLWNIDSGKCLVLTGHKGPVEWVAFSPQGDLVAYADSDNSVKLWSTESGECRKTLTGHTSSVFRVLYSPKGNQLASSSVDQTVRLWDAESGVCIHTLSGHRDFVRVILYSPQGNQLLSASYDKTLRLWDVETGVCLHVMSGHNSSIPSVSFSPNGDRIASASKDTTVRIWDVETGASLHTLTGHSGEVTTVAYSPLGDQVASASEDKTVRLWDPEAGVCLQTFLGHMFAVRSLAYSAKGNQIASSSDDMTVRLWDTAVVTSRHTCSGHTGQVLSVKFSPREDRVLSGSMDKTMRLWNVETGACRHILIGHVKAINRVVYSPQGDLFASASDDTTVRLWDAETGEWRKTLEGHTDWVLDVAYSPKGDQIASCSRDSTVRLWDVGTGVSSHTLSGHGGLVRSIMYSPQGNQLVSTSCDKTLRLWNAETGDCLHALTGHEEWVWFATYSPDGLQVASASRDKAVKLWDVLTGTCVHTLTGHENDVQWVAYSPQGEQIASASDDKTARLWDVASGVCTHKLAGHCSSVARVAYSPKGELVATASRDETVRLWDTTSGQCRVELKALLSPINDIAWKAAPELNHLVVGTYDGSVAMWEVVNGEENCQALLRWRTTQAEFNVKEATIQGIRGLRQIDRKLLKQRGTVGEPENPFYEAGKKVTSMASVVSKLKPQTDRVAEGISPDKPVESERHVEETAPFEG